MIKKINQYKNLWNYGYKQLAVSTGYKAILGITLDLILLIALILSIAFGSLLFYGMIYACISLLFIL